MAFIEIHGIPSPGAGGNAFLIGASGTTGEVLLNELLKRNTYAEIRLLGRKELELPDIETNTKVTQHVVDFENLLDAVDVFQGCDVGFCLLGANPNLGKAHHMKVCVDYFVNIASVAKQTGCQHFVILSAFLANKNSWMFIFEAKGLMEEAVTNIKLPIVTFFRAGPLLSPRKEFRIIDWLYNYIGHYIVDLIFPKKYSMPVPKLATAMVNYVSVSRDLQHVNFIDNYHIFELAEQSTS